MTEINDPAVARRRRKAIMQSQRSDSTSASASSEPPASSPPTTAAGSAAPQEEKTNKRKAPAEKNAQEDECEQKTKVPKQRGTASSSEGEKKKTQIRYDPDVPMSKEQLAAWRREARRVRNRESAAASRQRIRNRITELEDEVADWKSKYAEAMERLQTLETASKSSQKNGSEDNQA